MAAVKILTKELQKLEEEPIDGVTVSTSGDNMFEWLGTIDGPEGTPYEGGSFEFRIEIPKTYPKDDRGPQFTFTTKIFHPNVATNGKVDMSKQTVTFMIRMALSILSNPNDVDVPCDAEMVSEALKTFKDNRDIFNKIAKEWTKKYAVEEDEEDEDE